MRKRQSEDPLIREIEHAVRPGRFIRYDDMFHFAQSLDRVRLQLLGVTQSESQRALGLYEIFLAAISQKNEECDDSGAHLSMFFADLFCDWVKARQWAGCPADETLRQILKWKEHDDYGLCYQIERQLVKILDDAGYRALVDHYQKTIADAWMVENPGTPKVFFEYGKGIRSPALALKEMFQQKGESDSYAALCERLGLSPKDAEILAEMEIKKRRWALALAWAEKGLELEPTRNWHNEAGSSLTNLKPRILARLGRKKDALDLAWAEFEASPSEYAYENLMKLVPRVEKAGWHERAMTVAISLRELTLGMELLVKGREWVRLAALVHQAGNAQLEALSHYTTEPAAARLSKRDPSAAAKLFRAMGTRIVKAGKSRYYVEALKNLADARTHYLKAGQSGEWETFAAEFRAAYSRKTGFIRSFDEIAEPVVRRTPSFAEQARARWAKQTT